MNHPAYCLHTPHTDPQIEDKAREIYLEQCGSEGGIWELNETPQCWWEMAEDSLRKTDSD